jgi:hypothetical protein
MNKKDEAIFKHLIATYKDYWDRNQYYRTGHDEDLEYYAGYRNEQKYPLAFNENFNRILPIIYTILSRFMDQMYQSGNIVSVKPRHSKDIGAAKSAEAVLNYQLESLNDCDMQGGSYLTLMDWFFNALTFGKGILKMYWRKDERIGPKRMALPVPQLDSMGNFQGWGVKDHISMENQIFYDGPYAEVLHNKLFVPHPEYKSIQQMPACFVVYKKPIDHIRQKVLKGEYRKSALKELGWTSQGGGSGEHATDSMEAFCHTLHINNALSAEEIDNPKMRSPEVDIIECYTKLILEDAPYSVGSGLQIKGNEEEVIVHIGNYKTILALQRNTYGMRPLFDIGAYSQPEMYWDIGMVRLTKGIQEQINNLGNLRMQDAFMKINTMLRVSPSADIDPEDLVWRPFGLIGAEQGDIDPIVVPDMAQGLFMEQQQFYESTVQDLMGMYDYNMGQTPQRQERVGVVYGIQAMGEARAKLMLMSMDHMGIRPMLKYMMVLNTFHMPSGFEYRISDGGGEVNQFGNVFGNDIHPDFDFAARYTAMEPALGKQNRMQNLLQLAPVLQQNPMINQHAWLKTLFELGDIREADFLLKSPQQFQQEMEQQQRSAMMAQQMDKEMETKSKLLLSEKDFQEERVLQKEEANFDMALEAIKQKGAVKNAEVSKRGS